MKKLLAMKTATRLLLTPFVALALSTICLAESANPKLLFKTTAGDFKVELFAKEAPVTTQNILKYVESSFYEGTTFHRVVDDFVIQGGGFTKDMKRKETNPPIKNESANGIKNKKYTLSMARLSDPASATSQFFINLKDNKPLDREFVYGDGHGYAVFGKVIEGEEVIEKIRKAKTHSVRIPGSFRPLEDVPVEPIVIEKVEVLKAK